MATDNKLLNFKAKRTAQQISFAEIDPITQQSKTIFANDMICVN